LHYNTFSTKGKAEGANINLYTERFSATRSQFYSETGHFFLRPIERLQQKYVSCGSNS